MTSTVSDTELVKFLETYSLYKKLKGFPDCDNDIQVGDFEHWEGDGIGRVAGVKFEFNCQVCKKIRTFSSIEHKLLRQEESEHDDDWSNSHIVSVIHSISYRCTHCDRFHVDFVLLFDYANKRLQKIGQYPPWSISASKEVDRFLGEDVKLWEKAKVCESQSYGIAAAAYYRRVVENVIGQLLDKLEDLIPAAERESYSQALLDAREVHSAKEKIDIVKNLLPSTLRPEGKNPLGGIYAQLSRDLHHESDEDCIESAILIRIYLAYLIKEVATAGEAKREVKDAKDALRKLQARRRKAANK